MDQLNGKKTYIGAALMAVGVAVSFLGYPEFGEPIRDFGQSVAVVGLGHKIAKAST